MSARVTPDLKIPTPHLAIVFKHYGRLLCDRATVFVLDFRANRGTLTTETRIHVSDPISRRRFERYWRLVRPFSGIIRRRVLVAAKRRAEAS